MEFVQQQYAYANEQNEREMQFCHVQAVYTQRFILSVQRIKICITGTHWIRMRNKSPVGHLGFVFIERPLISKAGSPNSLDKHVHTCKEFIAI